MKRVSINTEQIMDWDAFHGLFASVFNFPIYYGQNMDAWIDCMDDLTNELTVLDLGNCRALKEAQPDIVAAIVECAAFVNHRRLEAGEEPVLLVAMHS